MAESRIKLPEELRSFLEVENCSDFPINRYYQTESLKNLYNQIMELRSLKQEMNSLGLEYLNSILLYGASGTGKTTFARFMAHKLDLDFAYINFAKVADAGFGRTARNISDVFRFMANTECVFVMDEIDCIAQKRNSTAGNEMNRITVTVMQELDYYRRHEVKSIIMGATNVQEQLDPALLSRFAIKFEMKHLLNNEKEEYIRNFLDDVNEQFDNDRKIVYDEKEINLYCAHNSYQEQRNIESDIIQGIATWVKNGHTDFHIKHIK